ncbi:MAG: hypothetical protein RL653_1944 [Pseudomonadota bacterium]|jgi:hypothetical protein
MAVASLALLCALPACTHATAQGVYVSDGGPRDFTTALSPYGDWVMTSGWGAAWRPWPSVVGPDFVPYVTGGRWVSTGYGWMFVTGWSWGWAPFHYGRWFFDPVWGWLWLPGNAWAPAWVEWRYGGGYVGWAPLGPPGWSMGYGGPGWCFVSVGALSAPDPWRYRLHGAEAVRAHDATAVLPPAPRDGPNIPVGPPPGEVARVSGTPVPRATVRPPPPGRAAPAEVRLPPNVQLPPPRPTPGDFPRSERRTFPQPGEPTPTPQAPPPGAPLPPPRSAPPPSAPPTPPQMPSVPAPRPGPAPSAPPSHPPRPSAPSPSPIPAPSPPPSYRPAPSAPPPSSPLPPSRPAPPPGSRRPGR